MKEAITNQSQDLEFTEGMGLPERLSEVLANSQTETPVNTTSMLERLDSARERLMQELLKHPRRYVAASAVALGGLGMVTVHRH